MWRQLSRTDGWSVQTSRPLMHASQLHSRTVHILVTQSIACTPIERSARLVITTRSPGTNTSCRPLSLSGRVLTSCFTAVPTLPKST